MIELEQSYYCIETRAFLEKNDIINYNTLFFSNDSNLIYHSEIDFLLEILTTSPLVLEEDKIRIIMSGSAAASEFIITSIFLDKPCLIIPEGYFLLELGVFNLLIRELNYIDIYNVNNLYISMPNDFVKKHWLHVITAIVVNNVKKKKKILLIDLIVPKKIYLQSRSVIKS